MSPDPSPACMGIRILYHRIERTDRIARGYPVSASKYQPNHMDCGPIAWQSWAAIVSAADQDFLRRA